ncbi:RING finger protein 141-like [Phalaenopsis equestris]|uniref:RING finger protein 141-like n=1 Tax=Phalaenopsis equestris TaxID=78828 RepID=UPI0009E1B5E9|nr:RING finger protein 141-like [Phalaenopsis equestris]
MFQNQPPRPSSFKGYLKALEADIQHANTLADAVHNVYGGAWLQMKLSYSPMAPVFLFLLQWVDCIPIYVLPSYLGLLQIVIYKVNAEEKSTLSPYERGASIKEFYAIIYPSLKQLQSEFVEKEESCDRGRNKEIVGRKRGEEWRKISDKDRDRDDECGICMEICTKMVLPSCNHAMCINCFHDWNKRSQSCPFCRGSLKRVRSRDLWVLTGSSDVVDRATLEKENVKRFYCFIDSLPLNIPDAHFLVYYDYML